MATAPVNVNPLDQIEQKVADSMRDWHELRQRYTTVCAQLEHMQRAYDKAVTECEVMKRRVDDAEFRMAFYMRHSTELKAHLTDIATIITQALHRAQDAAQRPDVSQPSQSNVDPLLLTNVQQELKRAADDIGKPMPKADGGAP